MLRLWLIGIYFEDNSYQERAFIADNAMDAIDKAVGVFPHAQSWFYPAHSIEEMR